MRDRVRDHPSIRVGERPLRAHVRAVDRELDQQTGGRGARLRVGDGAELAPGERGERARETIALRREELVEHLGARVARKRREVARLARELGLQTRQVLLAGGIEQHAVDQPDQLVAGGPVDRPIVRQRLVRAQDLLDP